MSTSNVTKDLVAGSFGGMAQVLIGQPFDIVKVRIQSASTGTASPLEVARAIATKEGTLAFWKGSVMPLVGIGFCVSLQFAGLSAAKDYLARWNHRTHASKDLSPSQLYMAGASGGLLNSVASGPVEHIRIRLQTQQTGATTSYRGPFDALTRIYTSDGVRGIYQGQVATMLRETWGYGWYFLAYEYLVAERCRKTGSARDALPATAAMTYGMVAGLTLWLTAYPIDVIKSRIQTDALPSVGEQRYHGIVDCARQIWTAQGFRGFTRGLLPTLIRAPPANAGTFAVYEAVRAALN